MSGGIVKVLGPNPNAPMKPRRLPKNCSGGQHYGANPEHNVYQEKPTKHPDT